MRVLLISGEFPPMQGGVGDYTRELGLALRDLGCRVSVVTSRQAGPVPGLDVYPVVECWDWGCWRSILGVIRHERPDVVHVQYQAAAYAMRPAINLLPRRLRLPGAGRPRIAVTFHDLKVPYLFPKAGPVRRWIVNELARTSDLAITTNREDLEFLQQVLTGPRPTLALVPIGSNIAPPDVLLIGDRPYDRDAWRARWGAGQGDLLLTFFGFVNDRKGVDTLLQALHRLVTEPSVTNPHLLMIGGQTGASDPTNVAYLAHIQSLVDELGLTGRVHWTGFTPPDEVTASFWAGDACVLPYRDGVSFLHGTFHAALAHGMPIVTTRPRVAGNVPELIDGENVLLVDREDAPALAAAIARLAANPSLRQSLGEGAGRLAQEFRWPKIAAETLALYRGR